MADEQPIIVIKKKITHGGHHGGAWKVAYADFVTAMMALFIVLWLMSSTSKPVQEAIGGYFRDPYGTASRKGTEQAGAANNLSLKKEDMSKLKDALLQAVHRVDNLDKLKKQVEITITQEGLRIELMEDPKGTFFEVGSAEPTPILRELLKALATEMGALPNKISIEGHTDAHAYSNSGTYGNWELSSDRANVARRLMQSSGVRVDQVAQVRGFAAQRLRKPEQPFDASNRRISLIVEYLTPPAAAPTATAAPAVNPGKVAGMAVKGE